MSYSYNIIGYCSTILLCFVVIFLVLLSCDILSLYFLFYLLSYYTWQEVRRLRDRHSKKDQVRERQRETERDREGEQRETERDREQRDKDKDSKRTHSTVREQIL